MDEVYSVTYNLVSR